jgi:signal transduction histidine kinase
MVNALKLGSSFRARLLLLLAALLIATLGVQYYLNLRTARNNARLIAEQEQALAAGVALGVQALSTTEYMIDLRKREPRLLLDEQAGRIINILVVDDQGQVQDSLNPNYNPSVDEKGNKRYTQLRDVPLPPLINAGQMADDLPQLPSATVAPTQLRAGQPRTFPFPVDTTQSRWYVIVALGSANMPSSIWSRQAARPLIYTLAILLATTLIAGVLVWRFTRPIKDLANGAHRVAAGEFDFRIPVTDRRDEMGALVTVFNEMIAKLGRTRELEVQLHQAEQSAVVGRLASAIAHEIRNPLNYINLTLDHLRNAFAPEDPQKHETFERLAVQLKTEVARINTRISEFLNYSRPARLELRPLDLQAELEDALRLVESEATERGIATSIEPQGDMPRVLGDAESLRSAFTNLIINGVQAMDGNGGSLTIRLTADASNDMARVEISDTGPGIAPENISQVFEPYFSTKETGTGLGLAIVKKAIDDHGGTINVKSKPGEGTTFSVTLPIERREGNKN